MQGQVQALTDPASGAHELVLKSYKLRQIGTTRVDKQLSGRTVGRSWLRKNRLFLDILRLGDE
jgi:hypothetical protein